MNIKWIGSPNFTSGREGNKVTGVIIHWMDGNLASADAVFQDTSRDTSAHFGIEDTTVHQYVKTDDTAYQAGNWDVNLVTIGIEHSAQPGRDASQATLDTSAQLIADLAQQYGFAINGSTVRPHSAIVATQCPGTVNISYIIAKANTLAGNPQPEPVQVPTPATATSTVTVDVDELYVRSAPITSAPLSGSKVLYKGNTFDIVGAVQGQMVSGISTWVKSQFGNYVWAGGLSGYNTSPPAPNSSGEVQIEADTLNARTAPNTSAPVGGVFHKGTAQYTGVIHGQSVTGNGKTSDIWLQSLNGNWFSSVWTSYE